MVSTRNWTLYSSPFSAFLRAWATSSGVEKTSGATSQAA